MVDLKAFLTIKVITFSYDFLRIYKVQQYLYSNLHLVGSRIAKDEQRWLLNVFLVEGTLSHGKEWHILYLQVFESFKN